MTEKKTTISGSVTTVESVTIDVWPSELVKKAIPYMKVEDVITVMYNLLLKKFIEVDPELEKYEVCWYSKTWELEDGYDYHKGLPMMKRIRSFNQFELDSLAIIEAIKGSLE